MKYEVEQNIPMPPASPGRRGEPTNPFDQMGTGDSFLFPIGRMQSISRSKNNYQAAHPGREFSIRKVSPFEARIWRTR